MPNASSCRLALPSTIAPASTSFCSTGAFGARPHVAQRRRAAGGRQVAAVDVVLDDDRQAGQRRQRRAAGAHGVDALRLGDRAGTVERDEGVEVLQALGPVERSRRHSSRPTCGPERIARQRRPSELIACIDAGIGAGGRRRHRLAARRSRAERRPSAGDRSTGLEDEACDSAWRRLMRLSFGALGDERQDVVARDQLAVLVGDLARPRRRRPGPRPSRPCGCGRSCACR